MESIISKKILVAAEADETWASFAVDDSRLITGPNPASGGRVADLLLMKLRNMAGQKI